MGFVAGEICISTPNNKQLGPKYAITLFASSALIGAICSLFIVEELKRLRPKNEDMIEEKD
jgi:hypothetical protein